MPAISPRIELRARLNAGETALVRELIEALGLPATAPRPASLGGAVDPLPVAAAPLVVVD